nr:MAG TPA: hypothetical protein [Caudoviricetes sp.]
MAKNPESVKIDNVKTIINNDSLCVYLIIISKCEQVYRSGKFLWLYPYRVIFWSRHIKQYHK